MNTGVQEGEFRKDNSQVFMLMSKAEIIVERNPILKISSKSYERFSNLHYIKDIRTQTETDRQTVSWTDGEMRSSHKALFSTS